MRENFLVTSREDMKRRGWDQLDFVYINGDAYVDHPVLPQPSSAASSKAGAIVSALFPSRIGTVPMPLKRWAGRGWPL